MPGPRRARTYGRPGLAILTGWVLLGLLALVVFSIHTSGDYNAAAPVGGDNAGPGMQALLHGNLDRYVDHQPVVGLTSILVRFPLVALASALGANALQGYQVGALACLLPLIVCGAWMVAAPGLATRQRLLRFLAVVLVIQSPIIHNGLAAGHPEGVLSTVLATMAVLAAMQGRARWAAVLLGLAVSSKETALIGVLPVLIAVPGRRRETAAIAGGIVLLLCASVWVSDPDAFIRTLHGEGATRYLTPFSLLWPVSAPLHIGSQLSVARVMPAGLTRTPASALMLVAVGALTAGWLVRAQTRGAKCQPLVLLALLGLLRCLCDSTHEAYYWITLLIPMATWEALEDRVPSKTLLLGVSVFVLYASLGRVAPGYLYTVSTCGEILLAYYLARHAMTVEPQPTPARSGFLTPGGPRWVLGGVRAGRQHELSVLNSSSHRPEPMAAVCDAPSTS